MVGAVKQAHKSLALGGQRRSTRHALAGLVHLRQDAEHGLSQEVVDDLPLPRFERVKDLTPQQIADFQKFIDIGVALRVVAAPVDVKTMLAPF